MYEMNAKNTACGGYAAQMQATLANQEYCDVAPPQPLTGEIASKLTALTGIIDDTSGCLVSLSDRLFGAVPRNASGANAANKPMGQAAEIGFILDALIDRARYAREEALKLNSRI